MNQRECLVNTHNLFVKSGGDIYVEEIQGYMYALIR